jgi:hypothetical protein
MKNRHTALTLFQQMKLALFDFYFLILNIEFLKKYITSYFGNYFQLNRSPRDDFFLKLIDMQFGQINVVIVLQEPLCASSSAI